jgi:hypothetical protein
MRHATSRAFLAATTCCFLLGLLACAPGVSLGSTEGAFKKACAKCKALEAVSGPQLEQARRSDPGRPLQLSGVIQGLSKSGAASHIILQMVDESTAMIEATGDRPEVQTGARVRCLVKPDSVSSRSRLNLVDIAWDTTPLDLLTQAARSALKMPAKDPEEIAAAAEALRRRQQQSATYALPTRGGDNTLAVQRAIAHFNPRLSAQEMQEITQGIVGYCAKYGFADFDDQMLVVAVIAAESRFNPRARSYKGAAGLGQLMPSTAAAYGVDPYDPSQNLDAAIRILRGNLDKYRGRADQWSLALAAYNAGSGAVKRHGGVPPYRETRNYLWRIYEYWCSLTGRQPVARQ